MSDQVTGRKITNQELSEALAGELGPYPNLRAVLPSGYPGAGVTLELMDDFEASRKKDTGHWHLANLPFVLFMANQEQWPDAKTIAASVLTALDEFCKAFQSTPGFQKVLVPLKRGIWKGDDPEFWSVLAHAYLSLMLRNLGFNVKAFSALILGGPKDADILVGLASGDAYVDIVMKHRPKFASVDEARSELHAHADEKFGLKFADAIKAGLQVFVVVVCVVRGQQLDVLDADPTILSAIDGSAVGRSAEAKAGFMVMAGLREGGTLKWRLFSKDEWAAMKPER